MLSLELVVNVELTDWEESACLERKQRDVCYSAVSCCNSRTPLYAGTLIFCQCFVMEFSTPGVLYSLAVAVPSSSKKEKLICG